MKGKNPSAQELTIKLLEYLAPARKVQIRAQARAMANDDAMEQLSLCMMIAGERNRAPQCRLPQSFIALAQTILSLQRGCRPEAITLSDIYSGLKRDQVDEDKAKMSAGNIVNRIEDHARLLRPEEIDSLCSGFRKESNRLFWINEIYRMFPELPVEDIEGGPVLDCLQALWNSLSVDEQKRMREIFPTRADWFEKLGIKEGQADALQGKPVDNLYEFIDEMRKKMKLTQAALCESLNIASADTYRSYKREWEAYEKNEKKSYFPRRKMSREQMLCILVLFQLDYATAVLVLGAAGYSFYDSERDSIVVKYLSGTEDERGNRQAQKAVLSRLYP